MKKEFAVGDHVFRWRRSLMGVPFAYQQHGIVVAVSSNNNNNSEKSSSSSIVIMNFDHYEEEEEEEEQEKGHKEKETKQQQKKEEEEDNHHHQHHEAKMNDKCSSKEYNIDNNNNNNTDFYYTKNQEKNANENNRETTTTTTTTTTTKIVTTTTTTRYCQMIPQRLTREKAHAEWEHVQYGQTQWSQRLASRAGTCSAATPDPVTVILCRLKFLQNINNNTISETTFQASSPLLLVSLPLYHYYKSNGECIAVWCMTGSYYSWQGCAKMGEAGLHVGSFSLVGGIAAQLAASVVVPVVLPFMAAYDVGQAVVSAKELYATKKEWQERTELWNDLFAQFVCFLNLKSQNKKMVHNN